MDATESTTTTPAWASKTKTIDRFFDRIEKRRVSAACIHGPHASGKSTTLVAHILRQVQAKIPDAPVVYLLPTLLEASYVVEYLASDDNNPLLTKISEHLVVDPPDEDALRPGMLWVASYDDMLYVLERHEGARFPFGARAVVLFDLEANPTTQGELLFGRLLEWVVSCYDAERPACAFMTISPAASTRTEAILDKVIGRKPDLIKIPTGEFGLLPFSSMGEQWRDEAKALLKVAFTPLPVETKPAEPELAETEPAEPELTEPEPTGPEPTGPKPAEPILKPAPKLPPDRVILGHKFLGPDIMAMDIPGIGPEFVTACQRDVKKLNLYGALIIEPTLGLSVPLRGMKHFVSVGVARDRVFDRKTSHIVSMLRQATKAEILREQSWLLKSNLYPKGNVVFHTKYRSSDFEKLPAGLDPPGRAYRGDLFWTALALVGQWPGKGPNELPIRAPPDDWAMAEIMRRLTVLRCIVPSGGVDIGKLSDRGRQVLQVRQSLHRMRVTDVDFHAAYFFTCVTRDGLSTNLQRVILRVATLSVYGLHTMCTKVESEANPTAEDIARLCAGVGAKNVHKGALWIALGLWQREAQRTITPNDSGVFPVLQPAPWLNLHLGVASRVQYMVRELEKGMGLEPTYSELVQTELNDDEVRYIDTQIMWAYLHKVVSLAPDVKQDPTDCVSHRSFSISKREILCLDEARKDEANRDGCFATYSDLLFDQGQYIIGNLTLIPKDLLKQVREERGKPFWALVATSYPLKP